MDFTVSKALRDQLCVRRAFFVGSYLQNGEFAGSSKWAHPHVLTHQSI
jgi:hypothetical protein